MEVVTVIKYFLKGGFHMYSYFIGIDIAKNTHWASCLSSDGEIILEPLKSTRMSKRGSGMLRYLLVYSAHNVVKYNQTFRDYYELKCSQGKSHYCALGHVAHKLVRIIFKMLKDNVAFNLD